MLHVEESIPSQPLLVALNLPQSGEITDIGGDNWSTTYTLGRRFRKVRLSLGSAEGTFLSQEDVYGYPPINVGADYPYDDLLARFYNTIHLFTDWRFDGPTPTFRGRKPLRHHSVRGEVAVRYKTFKYFTRCATWPKQDLVSNLVPFRSFIDGDFVSVDVSEDLQLLDVVSQLTGDLSHVTIMPWPENQGYYDGDVVDYQIHYVDNAIDLRVLTYYTSHWQGQINATWATVHRYCWYLEFETPQEYGIHLPLSEVVNSHYLEETVSSGMHFWAEQHPLSWYRNVLDPYLNSDIGPGHSDGFNNTVFSTNSAVGLAAGEPRLLECFGLRQPFRHLPTPVDFSFLRFTKTCDALLRDALPHAAIAAQDALDKSVSSLGLNMYESLPEYLGVFALVDVVKLAKDAVKLARSRSVGPSTLSAMLDILCDARLLYAYALSPSARDVKSIASGAKALRHRWFAGGEFVTSPLAGVHSLPVPAELCEPFGNVWLRSTVKVEGHLDPDSLLLRLLPLKAVGMLPELSLLWASLPFSFVVDNVLNVSNALSAIDTFLQTSYFYRTDVVTATHLFTWQPDISQIPAIDATQDEVHRYDFEYRSFYREIYPNIPIVGPSRILMQLYSTRIPTDWATYGALTYKVLKGMS